MEPHDFQRYYEYFRRRYDHWDALFAALCLAVPV